MEELLAKRDLISMPMMVIGNFNDLFNANEKKGRLDVQGVWRSLNVGQQICACLI